MKFCPGCKISKPLTMFGKKLASKDNLQNRCKECANNYAKEYRQIHKGKITEYQRKRIRECRKRYKQTLIGYLRIRFGDIRQRCDNPKCLRYKDWGGRGVKCLFESANDFINHIIIDLGYNTFEKIKGLQIDRIDNNEDYKFGNIRFVTAKENCNNRRKKETKCLA